MNVQHNNRLTSRHRIGNWGSNPGPGAPPSLQLTTEPSGYTFGARGGGQVVDAAVLVFAVKAGQVEDVLCVTVHYVGGDMVGEDRVGGKEK